MVREADADRARLHPAAARGDGRADPTLREKQPWQAAHDKDYAWLGDVITKHYNGDDSDVKVLMGGMLQAFGGMAVDDYVDAAGEYIRASQHPSLGRALCDCAYLPMVELLRYLEANGFTTLIASGGDATSCAASVTTSTASRPNG